MVFGPLATAQGKGIQADEATIEFPHTFADGHPAPPEFACGALLPTRAEFSDRAGHKEAAGAAFERLGRLDEHGLD